MVELVVGLGVSGLALIAVVTVIALVRTARLDTRARADLDASLAAGALPPSLHPRIDLDRCIGSGSCVEACPELDVLAVIDGKAQVVNPTSCIGHGECLRACPVDAIQLVLGDARRGVDIPLVDAQFQTAVPGLYVVGELGGMGLVANAMTQALQCMGAVVRSDPPRTDGVHQVLVVGAGPAGLAASLAAKAAGLDYVTVDQESLGGTVLHYPRHKLVMTRPVTLPLWGSLHFTEVEKERLLETWQRIVAETGLVVRERTAVERVRRREDGVFEVAVAGAPQILARRVVLAMGRRGTPRKLGVTGEEKAKVTYRLLDPEQYTGKRCLVVGGGDSAVEAACALGDAGAQVTISYRSEAFSRVKKKNQARIDAAGAAGTVALALGTTVTAIHDETVELTGPEGAVRLPNDFVLVFVGGVLPTAFLEAAGVEVHTFRGEAFAPANR